MSGLNIFLLLLQKVNQHKINGEKVE